MKLGEKVKMLRRRIILDVDVGTDDYLACLLFFDAERKGLVKIEAIICSCGNSTVENVCTNVVRMLELCNRTDIPVYKGASTSLVPHRNLQNQPKFHGEDGFGDLDCSTVPNLTIIKRQPASVALCNYIVENPKEISLICCAPLTNVALASLLHPEFVTSVKDIWIMGGNYTDELMNVNANCVNSRPKAEYNFYVDSEAVYIVLETFQCPKFILPFEICLPAVISFDWRFNTFPATVQHSSLELLTRADKAVYQSINNETFWNPCDAYLAAAFLHKDKIVLKSSQHQKGTVELLNLQTRGELILFDQNGKMSRSDGDSKDDVNDINVTIIEEISVEFFKRQLLDLNL